MNVQLTRPLVVFDLETTGINTQKDRIIEISMLKVFPNGDEELRTYRVNPTIPIPKDSSAIHGIFDQDVADKPTFNQLAKEIEHFLELCDFAGFNSNKFDFPLLVEEFYRAEIDFEIDNRKFIDVQRIFHTMEPRNLSAAYKFYCDRNLENAHSAEADTIATWNILKAQLDRYDNLPKDVKGLHEYSGQSRNVDLAGRFVYDNNKVAVFNFGKHRGKPIEWVLEKEPSYYKWMMDGDFPLQTKRVLTKIRLNLMNK
ncbi:exonuclease domain-containing protein [Bacteroidia bacterium]|jgi:DNA polymerase-3 subunit epsilon|nr:exonuclease domain-containing protein [Bacteroidia bacterium]